MNINNLITEDDTLGRDTQDNKVMPTNQTTEKPFKKKRKRRYLSFPASSQSRNEASQITTNSGIYTGLHPIVTDLSYNKGEDIL
jgi:hypothetical protein